MSELQRKEKERLLWLQLERLLEPLDRPGFSLEDISQGDLDKAAKILRQLTETR